MTVPAPKTMRDAMLNALIAQMSGDPSIFFLTADLGAPALDTLRRDFPDRFINVGIAEQNLINVSAGLALEGFRVFAFGITPFVSMRCFEQIRNNLALLSQIRPVNVNILSVGAGFSYEVSGPTHHGLEDLAALSALPNLTVFSPADPVCAAAFIPYALKDPRPTYCRLDGKPLPALYAPDQSFDFSTGFTVLHPGGRIGLVTTGSVTGPALDLCRNTPGWQDCVELLDVYLLRPDNEKALTRQLQNYSHIVTVEEGFTGRGGLDSYIGRLLLRSRHTATLDALGIPGHYLFEPGTRLQLRQACGFGPDGIRQAVENYIRL